MELTNAWANRKYVADDGVSYGKFAESHNVTSLYGDVQNTMCRLSESYALGGILKYSMTNRREAPRAERDPRK